MQLVSGYDNILVIHHGLVASLREWAELDWSEESFVVSQICEWCVHFVQTM